MGTVDVRSLDILKWARANGCPWNEETCACVAAGKKAKERKTSTEFSPDFHLQQCRGRFNMYARHRAAAG
jgi:hypothetical protein